MQISLRAAITLDNIVGARFGDGFFPAGRAVAFSVRDVVRAHAFRFDIHFCLNLGTILESDLGWGQGTVFRRQLQGDFDLLLFSHPVESEP
jgi:hypothetical protein